MKEITDEQQAKMQKNRVINNMKRKEGIVVPAYIPPTKRNPEGRIAENHWVTANSKILSYESISKFGVMQPPEMHEIIKDYSDPNRQRKYPTGKIECVDVTKQQIVWVSFAKAYINNVTDICPKHFGFDIHDFERRLLLGQVDPNYIEIHHINGNRQDNRIENLEALPRWIHQLFHGFINQVDDIKWSAYKEKYKNKLIEKELIKYANADIAVIDVDEGIYQLNVDEAVTVIHTDKGDVIIHNYGTIPEKMIYDEVLKQMETDEIMRKELESGRSIRVKYSYSDEVFRVSFQN